MSGRIIKCRAYQTNMDWALLRKQKRALLKIIYSNGHGIYGTNGRRIGRSVEVSPRDSRLLQGLLHLIDEIQDEAVDLERLSEQKVFGFGKGR